MRLVHCFTICFFVVNPSVLEYVISDEGLLLNSAYVTGDDALQFMELLSVVDMQRALGEDRKWTILFCKGGVKGFVYGLLFCSFWFSGKEWKNNF